VSIASYGRPRNNRLRTDVGLGIGLMNVVPPVTVRLEQ